MSAKPPVSEHCATCGTVLHWVDCWDCGGEGCKVYEDDEDGIDDVRTCDVCDGETGWRVCSRCNPGAFDD